MFGNFVKTILLSCYDFYPNECLMLQRSKVIFTYFEVKRISIKSFKYLPNEKNDNFEK